MSATSAVLLTRSARKYRRNLNINHIVELVEVVEVVEGRCWLLRRGEAEKDELLLGSKTVGRPDRAVCLDNNNRTLIFPAPPAGTERIRWVTPTLTPRTIYHHIVCSMLCWIPICENHREQTIQTMTRPGLLSLSFSLRSLVRRHREPGASGIQIGAGGAKTGHFLIRLF